MTLSRARAEPFEHRPVSNPRCAYALLTASRQGPPLWARGRIAMRHESTQAASLPFYPSRPPPSNDAAFSRVETDRIEPATGLCLLGGLFSSLSSDATRAPRLATDSKAQPQRASSFCLVVRVRAMSRMHTRAFLRLISPCKLSLRFTNKRWLQLAGGSFSLRATIKLAAEGCFEMEM